MFSPLPLALWSPTSSHHYVHSQCTESKLFQTVKVSTQKTEADLTDEQRKKGGIILGRSEEIIRLTVNLQDI